MLQAIVDGFNENQDNVTEELSIMLRRALPSFSSKSKSESQKNGSQIEGKKSCGGDSRKLDTIQEHKTALMLYGYRIIASMKNVMSLPFVVNWDWSSHFQHRHIAIAENRLHEKFILKIVGRDELEFMEYLSSPQMLSDPRNHTVRFSHVTGIDHGKSIIAMPKLLSLNDIPLSSLPTTQCYDLLQQMVEGFAFLHRHGVAHMDLKSANIVIDASLGRLYIIDFGLAHKVNGPDDTVSGFRGTKEWVAPEIEDDGYAYSAIRADLWAVGELIRTVLILWHKGRTPNNDLKELSTQLKSTDPLKRPMLIDILSKFDFSDHKRVSSDMPPLFQPDLGNNILLVH